MAKVFEQTTAALQDIISEDGQQGSSCLRLLETGNTAESQPDAAGEGQNHADHRGRSNIQPLHGLTERPPFQRISDIDPEVGKRPLSLTEPAVLLAIWKLEYVFTPLCMSLCLKALTCIIDLITLCSNQRQCSFTGSTLLQPLPKSPCLVCGLKVTLPAQQ